MLTRVTGARLVLLPRAHLVASDGPKALDTLAEASGRTGRRVGNYQRSL
jgi:hypothetical protein